MKTKAPTPDFGTHSLLQHSVDPLCMRSHLNNGLQRPSRHPVVTVRLTEYISAQGPIAEPLDANDNVPIGEDGKVAIFVGEAKIVRGWLVPKVSRREPS
jgi:hypothetical protein